MPTQEFKPKWSNLTKNKCPKCGKDLAKMFYDGRDSGQMIFCTCGFKISPQKMSEVVKKLQKRTFGGEKHYRPDDEIPDII